MQFSQNAKPFRRAWLLMLFFGCAAAVALYGSLARITAKPAPSARIAPQQDWPATPYPPTVDWSAFHAAPGNSAASPSQDNRGALAGRFRLAGTFFEMSEQPRRKAIIDDLTSHQQSLLGEGDRVTATVLLVRIKTDRVFLRENGREEELSLGFADPIAENMASEFQSASASASLSTNRFGSRVETNQWVLRRQELLNYYQEVLQAPERLAAVFASMKPLYKDQKITGYMLDIEGEGDFFRSFGLCEGDIIRKVNSMPMSNRGRAEYFIREFVEDRVNAFVLDIERAGQPGKLIFMVR